MKSKLLAASLFAGTAALVVFYPTPPSIGAVEPPPTVPPDLPGHVLQGEQPSIDVVFVLDTTGSMSGLLQTAKEKVWSIASTMASAQQAPRIQMGLVAYRDRGDAYVTEVVDLSEDLDSMYARLMDFQADGGGDGPESVNQALYDAVHKVTWSQGQDTYKVVFLVGDAPPHMDYQDDVKYPQTLTVAASKGIVVNAIQCGQSQQTQRQWQHIAQLGQGDYFQVGQAGSGVAIATPFDRTLAELSKELDETRMYYGTEAEKEERQKKIDAAAKLHSASSEASRARRAAFNASASGTRNLLGEGELVDDVASGRVDIADLQPAALPAPMQAMEPEEQQALIARTSERRDALKRRIEQLADQRSHYLREQVSELGGAEDSLDHRIYGTIREQAEGKGLRYEADALKY